MHRQPAGALQDMAMGALSSERLAQQRLPQRRRQKMARCRLTLTSLASSRPRWMPKRPAAEAGECCCGTLLGFAFLSVVAVSKFDIVSWCLKC